MKPSDDFMITEKTISFSKGLPHHWNNELGGILLPGSQSKLYLTCNLDNLIDFKACRFWFGD